MNTAGLEDIKRWHRRNANVVRALAEETAQGSAEQSGAALTAFFDGPALELEGHLDLEEREVFPLVAQLLRHDTGILDSLRAEHETIRLLLGLLRSSREAPGGPGRNDALSALNDLALLLASHFHKEDDLVNPLLARLLLERPS